MSKQAPHLPQTSQNLLTETGLVTKLEDGFAWVNTRSRLACSSCQLESSCGNGILEKYLAGKVFVSKVSNEISAGVGDEVVIGIPRSNLNKAALLVYFLPLAGLLLGALLGKVIFASEPALIFTSLIGFCMGLFAIKAYSCGKKRQQAYTPQILSKKPSGVDASVFDSIEISPIEIDRH